ncbi:hypothetical protein TIFTF001_027457 [Ficus carica]|uniref:Retrotransposon gag domain-containing protein n=1 Tax=Ficus carica TaxID=3494 RepID=A0AA88J098_FICCA|nr:hypothetical protein TIFTF001_027457 [Ficus carica]
MSGPQQLVTMNIHCVESNRIPWDQLSSHYLRPLAHVDQRIDQLTQIVGTLVNTFQNWVTNNRGNQPQPSNPVDLVGGNGANGRLETHTKGTRGTVGKRSDVYGLRALRRAQEREVVANGGRHQGGDNPGLPPRSPRRDIVPGELVSVQNRRDLRERLTPQIALYEGKTDPDDHLELYIRHMVLHRYPEEIICKAFRNTLYGAARRWFAAPKQNLTITYQGPHESLKDWLTQFSVEMVAIYEILDKEALMGAMNSMRHNIPFGDDLNQNPAKTCQGFLEKAQGFINAEEAKSSALKSKIAVLKNTNNVEQSNEKQNGKKKQRD